MKSSHRAYLPHLDVIRAVAAWWVVGYHTVIRFTPAGELPYMWTGSSNPVLVLLSQGWLAVSLFVLLSGYSLSIGLRRGPIVWSRYIGARWLRIAPLYLVVLAFGTLAATAQPSAGSMFGALTMLPLPDAFTPGPWLATAWSVRVEFVLYLALPAFVYVLRRHPARRSLLMGAVLVVVVGAALARTSTSIDVLYWGLPGRLVEFGAGVALGWAGHSIPRRGRRCVVAAVLAGFVAVSYVANRAGGLLVLPGTTRLAVFVVVLLLGCLLLACVDQRGEVRRTRVLDAASTVGTWTYSTYLWHAVVVNLVVAPVLFDQPTALGFRGSLAAGLIATAVIVLPLSWASFHLVEKPFLSLRPNYVGGAGGTERTPQVPGPGTASRAAAPPRNPTSDGRPLPVGGPPTTPLARPAVATPPHVLEDLAVGPRASTGRGAGASA